jgi:hypothetical protein
MRLQEHRLNGPQRHCTRLYRNNDESHSDVSITLLRARFALARSADDAHTMAAPSQMGVIHLF